MKKLIFCIIAIVIFTKTAKAAENVFTDGDGSENNPYQISNCLELQAIADFPDKNYILINDIDCSATAISDKNNAKYNNSLYNDGTGFSPIGQTTPFSGTLDGRNYTINNLTSNNTKSLNIYTTLIHKTSVSASILNIGLTNISLSAIGGIAGLVGENHGVIKNSYATGKITAIPDSYNSSGNIGGLVENNAGSIINSWTNIEIKSDAGSMSYTGGFINGNNGYIINCYAQGLISGGFETVGGFVAVNNKYIANSFSNVNFTYKSIVITDTEGNELPLQNTNTGGFAGNNFENGVIINSYSTGDMHLASTFSSAGFSNFNSGKIINSYTTSKMICDNEVCFYLGYFASTNEGTIENSFWDTNIIGNNPDMYESYTLNFGTGKTTIELQNQTTFTNWDFNGAWQIQANQYPIHIWQSMAGGGTSFDPRLITNINELQSINYSLTDYYKLDNNINAQSTNDWNNAKGFMPISICQATGQCIENFNEFTGVLDGNNKTISGLYVNRDDDKDGGLFYKIGETSSVKNLWIRNSSVSTKKNTGILAAINNGQINEVVVSGSVIGKNTTGGGFSNAGGLFGASEGGTINNCYSTASVKGNDSTGGLIGYTTRFASIHNSYASGNVDGNYTAGGFIGYNDSSNIYSSFSTGAVVGKQVGGFIGINDTSSNINNINTLSNSGWHSSTANLSSIYASGFYQYNQTTNQKEWVEGTTPILSYLEKSINPFYKNNHDIYIKASPIWDFTKTWSARSYELPKLQWQGAFYSLTYLASEGGEIIGEAEQIISPDADGTPVTALASDGYEFQKWNDGLTNNPRTDLNVSKTKTITAIFKKIATIPSVTITGGGGSILLPTKEAKLVINIETTSSTNKGSYVYKPIKFSALSSKNMTIWQYTLQIIYINIKTGYTMLRIEPGNINFKPTFGTAIAMDLDKDKINDVHLTITKLNNYQLELTIKSLLSKPLLGVKPTTAKKFTFSKDYKLGANNTDIKKLQEFLNTKGYIINKTGAGSPGKETTKFDLATKNALVKYQKDKKLKTTGTLDAATRKIMNK